MKAMDLAAAMGNSLPLSRYEQLVEAFNEALFAANCTTVNRAAMFCAQVGHESAGLRYMEEIASGADYEWREDLGNVYPGDGVRFKGRGPIQITGRHNYTAVSKWAHDKGYVPTPTYFVDNPSELASDRYAFLGPVWYWTVARDMNSYADRQDIEGATRAVNGGTNGLTDRTQRWNNCLRMGDRLLPERTAMSWKNSEGIDVNDQTALYWIDLRARLILDQLGGPDAIGKSFPGWPQLGDRTVVNALAKIGHKLGIEGFQDPDAPEAE